MLVSRCYYHVTMAAYLWLDCHITVDPTLIHRIIGLSMQGPDPQDFYLKVADRSTCTEDQGYIWRR
jgi:hypothetical protein